MQDVYFLVSIPQFFEIKHVRFTLIIQIISGIEKERERVKKVFSKIHQNIIMKMLQV